MRKINREDMLELTRRMTVKRNCFDRIAGAYLDEEGYVDATFNRHFLKLKLNEQAENLAIAKEIPFADTNKNLREYAFPEDAQKPGSIWQLLMALKPQAVIQVNFVDQPVGEEILTEEANEGEEGG